MTAPRTDRPENQDLNHDASKHFLFTTVSTPEIGARPASRVMATTIKSQRCTVNPPPLYRAECSENWHYASISVQTQAKYHLIIHEAKVNVHLLCRAVLHIYLALLFERSFRISGQLEWELSECARHCDPVITGLGGFSSAPKMNKFCVFLSSFFVDGVVASGRYLDQGILTNE